MERLTSLFAEDIEDQVTLEASLGGIADETERGDGAELSLHFP